MRDENRANLSKSVRLLLMMMVFGVVAQRMNADTRQRYIMNNVYDVRIRRRMLLSE